MQSPTSRHYEHLPLTRRVVDQPWRRDALCRDLCRSGDAEPSWWFPQQHRPTPELEQARAICLRCPVRAECLDWALKLPELHGLWGAMSPRQRRRVSTIRVSLCQTCGIEFHYSIDSGRKTPKVYCSQPCKDTGRAVQKERSNRRRS